MSNGLSEEKKQQVIAMGTGVRRETAGVYLRAAAIAVRIPRAWEASAGKIAQQSDLLCRQSL